MPDVGPWRLGAARGGPAERRQFEPAQPCFEVGGQRGCSRAHDTSPAVVAYSSRRRLGTLGRSTTSASPGLEGRGRPCWQAAFRHNWPHRRSLWSPRPTPSTCAQNVKGATWASNNFSDCRTFCRRLGPGGACPCCDEAISVAEVLSPDQFLGSLGSKAGKTVTARK